MVWFSVLMWVILTRWLGMLQSIAIGRRGYPWIPTKGDGDRMVMSCDTPVLQLTNIKIPVIAWDYRTPKTFFWSCLWTITMRISPVTQIRLFFCMFFCGPRALDHWIAKNEDFISTNWNMSHMSPTKGWFGSPTLGIEPPICCQHRARIENKDFASPKKQEYKRQDSRNELVHYFDVSVVQLYIYRERDTLYVCIYVYGNILHNSWLYYGHQPLTYELGCSPKYGYLVVKGCCIFCRF